MPPLIPDNRRRLLLRMLVVAPLAFTHRAQAAAVSSERIVWEADGLSGNLSESATFLVPRVRQGTTLLRARKADATFIEGEINNSTWKFTGDVHLEFDGVVLDAEAATAVFASGRLSSVVVQAASSQQARKSVHVEHNGAVLDFETATISFLDNRISEIQAQGKPALFSHMLKRNGRRVNGRASKVDYDARKSVVRFGVDAWFSNGVHETQVKGLTYNLADGQIVGGASTGESRLEELVPAPRTPDRATAK